MRWLVLVLLTAACAGQALKPTVTAGDWVTQEKVWVDPDPGSSLGWGSSMDGAARTLQRTLLEAGMQQGARDDPQSLVVKLDMASGAVTFSFSYKLLRGPALVEEGSFTGNDLDCWSLFMPVGQKGQCVAREYANRILTSRVLALEHKGAAPAAPAAATSASKPKLSGRLAVLDLRLLTKELTQDDARYFTDLVRTAVLKRAPGLDVITRENLLVLLQSTGRKLEECEGECEVDTGRRIGADSIVSGEIQKVGTRFKMSLRLHETREGRLVSAAVASGQTIDELDDGANKAAAQLFEGQK